VGVKKRGVTIGRPGYRVTKQVDPDTGARSLLFQVEYPEVDVKRAGAGDAASAAAAARPVRHRFMSAFEQRREAADPAYQYLLFAADPYDTIAFKIPNAEVDRAGGAFLVHWDADVKTYTLQLPFTPGAALPDSRKAATMPGRTTWAMASPSRDWRRSKRNVPGPAQASAAKVAMTMGGRVRARNSEPMASGHPIGMAQAGAGAGLRNQASAGGEKRRGGKGGEGGVVSPFRNSSISFAKAMIS
jgi:hypothetical protein